MASCVDLTVQAVPTSACFVHDMQFAVSIAKLLEHARDGIRGVADPAVETHITRSLSGDMKNSYERRRIRRVTCG
jgi:hypothetical protein